MDRQCAVKQYSVSQFSILAIVLLFAIWRIHKRIYKQQKNPKNQKKLPVYFGRVWMCNLLCKQSKGNILFLVTNAFEVAEFYKQNEFDETEDKAKKKPTKRYWNHFGCGYIHKFTRYTWWCDVPVSVSVSVPVSVSVFSGCVCDLKRCLYHRWSLEINMICTAFQVFLPQNPRLQSIIFAVRQNKNRKKTKIKKQKYNLLSLFIFRTCGVFRNRSACIHVHYMNRWKL